MIAAIPNQPRGKFGILRGDTLDWIPFWESFNDAIKKSLSNVQKHHFVNNLELTDANHEIAICKLKKVYGEKGVLNDSHFDNWILCSR